MEQIREQDLMPSIGYFCPVELDERDDEEIRVVTVNEPFDMSKVINPDDYPLPKEGTVGYVKVEREHYEGSELKPRLFKVDDYRFETVG